jgi:hypothetical protein
MVGLRTGSGCTSVFLEELKTHPKPAISVAGLRAIIRMWTYEARLLVVTVRLRMRLTTISFCVRNDSAPILGYYINMLTS